MMGAESVEYHRATVIGRVDDHPGRAMEYFASRGETPLVWGGSGAASFGFAGAVSADSYEAVFGPGGAKDPRTGERLVRTRRPGMEVVISAHKSVAELGVIGRAEDMHLIMDGERDATLAYLDRVTRETGGRRGEAAKATPTGGLVYAHTRHATSRAGDPCPHDHVLLANLLEMKDEQGGWKAADTALWREHLHAATMTGRMAAARVAVELGYGIEADPGPSGRLGHWKIAGVPDEVMAAHSKRAAEIEAECQRRGDTSYRARGVAARTTRTAKHHEPEGQLVERWRAELASVGWPVERLAGAVDAAAAAAQPALMSFDDARRLNTDLLAPDGELARRKVFSRRHVVVELAPHLYGQRPALLDALADRALADPEAVPIIGVAGARERVYSLAGVLAQEAAIAEGLGRQLARTDAPAAGMSTVAQAIARAEEALGGPLSEGQRAAAEAVCISGRGAELVVGVAGSGKTTMLKVVADAFERSGCQVLGTATSGQAARTLGKEAGIGESRTLASLAWRLDHHQVQLDDHSVVVLDEAGLTDDADLVRLAAHVEGAGAKLVLLGDDRQLGPVGPGGALGALVARHPGALHSLTENRRQADPEEREALAQLRAGDVGKALDWYLREQRAHAVPDRGTALQAAVGAWAADVAAGHETGLYAWRRANVAELNARARNWMGESGRLTGPELVLPDGGRYRAGDEVIALCPSADGTLVTSQRATVKSVDLAQGTLTLRTADGGHIPLGAGDASSDRLGYAYATTVHRCQGATTARSHLLADGGGRELAYVAMSRAREAAHVWVVADDLGQAREDLERDWSSERRPAWAIDTGLPDPYEPGPATVTALPAGDRARVVAVARAQARLGADALRAAIPPDPVPKLEEAKAALARLQRGRADLEAGVGAYEGTGAGQAARELRAARAQLRAAEDTAKHGRSWGDRHASRRRVPALSEAANEAQRRWDALVAPGLADLNSDVANAEAVVAQLTAAVERHRAVPRETARRWLDAASTSGALARRLEAYRDQLDGVPLRPHPSAVAGAAPRSLHPSPQWSPPSEPGLSKSL
ncbi:MAG: MobF family relaxase [Acidimicrobiales bacterium]|jgi:conjugative relaxase-like TrwC/TraI family protein